jgi:hypothetical protein
MPNAYDKLQPPTGDGSFYKLNEGENRVRLLTEPSERGVHYVQAEKKSYSCLGEGKCRFCDAGDKPKVRFLYYVIDRAEKGPKTVKLAEFGWQIVGFIKELHDSEEYGFDDVPPYDISITKSGSGLDTSYTVLASLKDTALTDDEVAQLAAMQSLDEVIDAMKKKVVPLGGEAHGEAANGEAKTDEEVLKKDLNF